MLHLRTSLIDCYRWMTWPLRRLRLAQLKRRGQVPVAILFYHRVDDEHPNPWTISNRDFEAQLEWLQSNFDLVSLEECQRRIRSGYNDRPTVALTFDDGYADNGHLALPHLIERQIPVTYFVTTRNAVEGRAFDHDEEHGRPLPTDNLETLRSLVAAGIEIGGHARDHIDLGKLNDPDELYDQVITASRELGDKIGQPIRYFAFPFGQPENLSRRSFDLLFEHGFEAVCSAYGGFNAIGDDAFHLQRMHGDPNLSRLKNWLTLDPRLNFNVLYDYHPPAFPPAAPEASTVDQPDLEPTPLP